MRQTIALRVMNETCSFSNPHARIRWKLPSRLSQCHKDLVGRFLAVMIDKIRYDLKSKYLYLNETSVRRTVVANGK
jgi:hypothetical protein